MIRTIFFPHVTAAILVSGIILLVYTSVQQEYRTGANDPQIQIARDAVSRLKQGKPLNEIMPADTIDLGQSLGIFMQFYDAKNNLLLSNGFDGSKAPTVPPGVLDYAKENNEYMVSWQPSPNVRMASVVIYTGADKAAYVLVGRSLLEVEKREDALVKMVVMCWILCMTVICAHALLQVYLAKKEKA